jgi:hypothetical protein
MLSAESGGEAFFWASRHMKAAHFHKPDQHQPGNDPASIVYLDRLSSPRWVRRKQIFRRFSKGLARVQWLNVNNKAAQ